MSEPQIHLRTVTGEQEQTYYVDEVIIVLPTGIEFSLFAGYEEDNEVVAFVKTGAPVTPYRFVLRPGAVNQLGISVERPVQLTNAATDGPD